MMARQRIELVRQCENQVRVGHVEQFGDACAAPGIGRLLLTARAVSGAARVPAPLGRTACIAGELLPAQGGRAAGGDRAATWACAALMS
jgi:hypothetical protein